MQPVINRPLTNEEVYAIADAIAVACTRVEPHTIKDNYNFYFREIINSTIRLNKQDVVLATAVLEDDARHITATVLKRLQAPTLLRGRANIEVPSTVEAQ